MADCNDLRHQHHTPVPVALRYENPH
jgi:hypothetical protein